MIHRAILGNTAKRNRELSVKCMQGKVRAREDSVCTHHLRHHLHHDDLFNIPSFFAISFFFFLRWNVVTGSIERMLGILIEHTGGRWPLWLSPRQLVVCNITDAHAAYAQRLATRLFELGYHAEADLSAQTLNKF
jgi:hypothetical protein